MILTLTDVLSKDELSEIMAHLQQAQWVEGKLTAGWHAQWVKDNQQLNPQSPKTQALIKQIKIALNRHPVFAAATYPKVIHSLLFSRYQVGMSYGRHIDNALMGNDQLYRSDLSFTVFLNTPTSYQGGELVIEAVDGEKSYKLAEGCALIYPSTRLHSVNPVTQGTRWVAVGWIQSLIRDPSEREILFDLETTRRLIFAKEGKTAEFDLISQIIANLLRKWAEI